MRQRRCPCDLRQDHRRCPQRAAIWLCAALLSVGTPRLDAAPAQHPVPTARVLEPELYRQRHGLTRSARFRQEIALGQRIALNENWSIEHEWILPPYKPEEVYSHDLQTLFRITGPTYLPEEPEFFLYDGTYYVYEPLSYSDPGIEIQALPRALHQETLLQEAQMSLWRRQVRKSLDDRNRDGGQGFEFTIAKSLPLMDFIGLRGGANLKVSGRESISFAGESRRVSPFVQTERGSGQSLFPRLDMDQDLQVKLEGTIGEKIHVQVDHNSNAIGLDANRIKVWYEAFEDDIVQRIDLGSTNLNLPGSNLVSFAGGSQGLFGLKTDLRIGRLDLTLVAAKQETEAESRSLTPSLGAATPTPISEASYLRDQFFFYVQPDTTLSIDPDQALFQWETYGIDIGQFVDEVTYIPGDLFEQEQSTQLEIYVDDQETVSEQERTYRGYAVASENLATTPSDTLTLFNAYAGAPNTHRYPPVPGDPFDAANYVPGKWRRVPSEDIGLVIFRVGNRSLVMGFFLRTGAVGDDDVIGIRYETPNGAIVGNVDEATSPPQVRLKLIRHPEQTNAFAAHPTNLLMMRHVYRLNSSNITNVEISITSNDPSRQNPDTPPNLPNSTYLHMFGLDDLDVSNVASPDGLFDQSRINVWDPVEGYLFMPGWRPFDPPDPVVQARLVTAGVDPNDAAANLDSLFGLQERVGEAMYVLPPDDQDSRPLRFNLDVRSAGTNTEIFLPNDIIPGSEIVTLDGRTLTAGTDYDIEPFAGGKITLKGAALNELGPSSRIQVSYQYRPFIGGGSASIFGASAQYKLGNRGQLSTVWMFEGKRGFSERPRLGEEPSRTLVGDVNGSMSFRPGWMTRLVDLLPFTNTTTPSSLNLSGEVAMSLPNPNTKNTAFIDDMESAEDSDNFSMSRSNWFYASLPHPGSDPSMEGFTRIPLSYYNPVEEVKRGHMNPRLDANEADDGVSVLEIGFSQSHLDSLLANPTVPYDTLWSGVMTSFAGNGLDLTQTRSIEFWLNDDRPDNRRGNMYIDFGDISEDFIFFENPRPFTSSRFNREAESFIDFNAQNDDLGWNGVEDGCNSYGADNPPPERDLSSTLNGGGIDCSVPSAFVGVGATRQHAWANGTERNNRYDTEDINGNGRFDESNRFFRIRVPLEDLQYIVTDVRNDPELQQDIANLPAQVRDTMQYWRKYRIDFESLDLDQMIIKDTGAADPTLRQIRYVRIWFDDPGATTGPGELLFRKNIQLFDFKFAGTQWVQRGVFQQDGDEIEPAPGESFSVGVINNKDDPIYADNPAPDTEDLDSRGIQVREQSLRLNFKDLMPGHEMVARRDFNVSGSRKLDLTLYRELNYFVHYFAGGDAAPIPSDPAKFFLRLGSTDNSFYEIEHDIPSNGNWQEINILLSTLTSLKFLSGPLLPIGNDMVEQVTTQVFDIREPAGTPLVLTIRRRGNPSLVEVQSMWAGIRHVDPDPNSMAPPATGEVWFNNIRLEQVEKDLGVAQSYSATAKFADVLDWSGSLARRDAEFRGLRETRTTRGANTLGLQTRFSTDISRLVPTMGFQIPVSYNFSRNVSRPKFFSGSDTRNTPELADRQRREDVSKTYAISVSKQASKFWLFRPTIDPLRFSYNEGHRESRSWAARDTSVSWSTSVTYDLGIRPRTFKLWKYDLSLLPTNVKVDVRHDHQRSQSFTVAREGIADISEGTLEARPVSRTRNLRIAGSTAFRPINTVSLRYQFNEPRSYRLAHPENETERVKIFGFDLGIPSGRGETFALDYSPRIFRFNYTSSYNNSRTTSLTLPDQHGAANRRDRRLSFDFGLHRKLGNWKWFQEEPRRRPPPKPQQGQGDGEAGSDSTEAESKFRPPNPIKLLFRKLAQIDPIKVELSDNLTANYINLPEQPTYMYRLGLTRDSGLDGFENPSPLDKRNTLDLSTVIPLRGSLRMTTRYGRRETDRRTLSGTASVRTHRENSVETSWPSLELSINNFQKLPIFSSKLERSTLSLGFARTETSSGATDSEGGVITRRSNQRSSKRQSFNSNWTGTWVGGVTSALSATQTTTQDQLPGSKTENTRRQINGSVRFKIAPQNGLRVPILGRLDTGMDVSFNGSYTTDQVKRFNNPNSENFVLDRNSSSLSLAARGDYTLSRSMNGGLEMGFTRTARNDRVDQTITTFRLGFNLTFTF